MSTPPPKTPRRSLIKYLHDLYGENYKTLWKDIKGSLFNWREKINGQEDLIFKCIFSLLTYKWYISNQNPNKYTKRHVQDFHNSMIHYCPKLKPPKYPSKVKWTNCSIFLKWVDYTAMKINYSHIQSNTKNFKHIKETTNGIHTAWLPLYKV